jgi:hypothetical protein
MEAALEPVFHKRSPAASVERMEVPSQLSTTVTTGVAGVDFGSAMPDPGALKQPLMVVVTVYIPAVFTVMEAAVEPLFHNKSPEAFVERVEVPSQLSTTVTTGVSSTAPGAAVPVPGKLVQPPAVLVTV